MTTEEKYRDEAVDKLSLFTRLQDKLIDLSMEGKLENDNKYMKEYTAIREEIIKALVAKRIGEETVENELKTDQNKQGQEKACGYHG
jgi:hypothetical protein